MSLKCIKQSVLNFYRRLLNFITILITAAAAAATVATVAVTAAAAAAIAITTDNIFLFLFLFLCCVIIDSPLNSVSLKGSGLLPASRTCSANAGSHSRIFKFVSPSILDVST